jgi:hypothetical protein
MNYGLQHGNNRRKLSGEEKIILEIKRNRRGERHVDSKTIQAEHRRHEV